MPHEQGEPPGIMKTVPHLRDLKNITTCTYKPEGHIKKWNFCGTVGWPTQPIVTNSKNKIWHKENTIQKELITKTALQRKTSHTIIITKFPKYTFVK
jgi:hypothetical protein